MLLLKKTLNYVSGPSGQVLKAALTQGASMMCRLCAQSSPFSQPLKDRPDTIEALNFCLEMDLDFEEDKKVIFVQLDQWFPTTTPGTCPSAPPQKSKFGLAGLFFKVWELSLNFICRCSPNYKRLGTHCLKLDYAGKLITVWIWIAYFHKKFSWQS